MRVRVSRAASAPGRRSEFRREPCGHDYCGREPALPAFSTGAHPLKRVGAVSCFLWFLWFQRITKTRKPQPLPQMNFLMTFSMNFLMDFLIRRRRRLWLPAKPAFLVCDGSTDRQQQQQIGAQNVTFQKYSHFSKFSENATPLSKIDESSKLLRYVPR